MSSFAFPGWRITLLALAFALGITLGWKHAQPWVWPWLGLSALLLVASAVVQIVQARAVRAWAETPTDVDDPPWRDADGADGIAHPESSGALGGSDVPSPPAPLPRGEGSGSSSLSAPSATSVDAWPSRLHLAFVLLALSMLAFGAGWVTLRHERVAVDDLAAVIGDAPVMLRVRGVALGAPVLRSRTAGSMAQFDYRQPGTYFPMRIDALVPRAGEAIPVRSKALVRVDHALTPFRAGDRIEALGFMTRPASPRNPGEFDYRRYAKSLGQAGIFSVASRELIQVAPASRSAIGAAFLRWRDDLRRRAGAWLLADLPPSARGARDSLLANLLLGEREAEIDGQYESFQRVGLAHLLAISGFHLSVLAGSVLLAARMLGGEKRWHALLVIGAVLLYLVLIEVRMPVLRAAVMTIAASLALVAGRRLRVGGLIALSALLLLVWRPDELFNPGFQLTFGVVLGLAYFAPPVRRRWFGRADTSPATIGAMLKEWLKTATAASVVAWLIATPIAVYHFGAIAPLGAPASIVGVPVSAALLALGYLKIVLGALAPSAAWLVGIPLSLLADFLLALVEALDEIPLAFVAVPYPGAIWALAALAWAGWWSVAGGIERLKRTRRLAFALLTLWLMTPALAERLPESWLDRPALRIDMLAVGDGSCYVIRSGGEAVVFDAGSSSDLDAGRRSIIPALRRLGVRALDAVCVSHANLDHYSAVLELTEAFGAREALVTTAFLEAAESDPFGSAADLLQQLTARRIVVRTVAAGDERRFGNAMFRWLHPQAQSADGSAGVAFERVNDTSMVIRIECAGRRALLCGDIQADAMALLLRAQADIAANVLELPHHGSYHEAAIVFVRAVQPQIAMQSTGVMRWRRDQWEAALRGVERLVTARDGACWVEIAADGTITTGRFLDPGEWAGGEE